MFIEISTHIALRWSAIHFVRGAIDILHLWTKPGSYFSGGVVGGGLR